MATRNHPDNANPEHHTRVRNRARTHFDQWANSYDRSVLNELVFFPTIRACREQIIRWQQQRGSQPYRLLDVGCGTGRLLTVLAEDSRAEALVGLDFSAPMVQRVQEKIDNHGLHNRLSIIHGDAEHLPFDQASFDVITCCNSFHHYPHQPAVIRGFHRVLKPGGMLILTDGFRDNVIGWFIFDVCVALVEGHVHHAPWSSVRRMFEQAGFKSLEQHKINVLAPLLVNVATR
ncbi:MAG: methyltransferase domain-containing protein [Planctomycetota bacterium]